MAAKLQAACVRWACAAAALGMGSALAQGETALDAIKHLPKDQAARVARIEGEDGTPDPERWYILTQDTNVENGVHEFVVSNGEIVASRSISQFADSLKPADMLGDAPPKLDSDKAAKVARDYAEANGAVVTSMNYELKKEGPDAAPAWTISCMDDKGNKVGSVVVTAGKGNVVSHDGFALDPVTQTKPREEPSHKDAPHFETYAEPQVAATTVATAGSSPGEEGPDDGPPGHHHHHHVAKKPESAIGKTFDNVGRTLKKFFPF